MDLWIAVTIGATLFQTLRFVLQKRLSMGTLSTAGATFARFAYSAPFVVAILYTYIWMSGRSIPDVSWQFWGFGALGGLAQILATVCIVALFRSRNFAVGVTFKKTEVIQAAFMGLLLLGEGVSLLGFAAIFVGLIGVLLLSGGADWRETGFRGVFDRASGLGLLSGFLFAISGVAYRGASLELPDLAPLFRAGVTLAAVTAMQMIAMMIWLRLREAGQITAVWQARQKAVWIGMFSMAGSICWFTAFTLQNAAYVKAVGQVELIFSLAASWLFFKEKLTQREAIGIAILTLSILMLVTLL